MIHIPYRLAIAAGAAAGMTLGPSTASAQGAAPSCAFICSPTITVEPAVIRSHLAMSPRVRKLSDGSLSRLSASTSAEVLVVIAAPTALPRTSLFTSLQWLPDARAARNPFTEYTASEIGESKIRANTLSATFGLSVAALQPQQTGGWLTLSPYVGDLFSTAARPNDGSAYTHKLDLGLNLTASPFSHLTPKFTWLHGVSAFAILDYVATGLPRAGDEVPLGERVFVDDAHALSLIAGVGLPLSSSAKH